MSEASIQPGPLPADRTVATAMRALAPLREPEFNWGRRVIALDDLYNDGSHPEQPDGALLAARGSVGEVVKVGRATESSEPIYLVEFGADSGFSCVIGCFEEEIASAPDGLLSEPREAT